MWGKCEDLLMFIRELGAKRNQSGQTVRAFPHFLSGTAEPRLGFASLRKTPMSELFNLSSRLPRVRSESGATSLLTQPSSTRASIAQRLLREWGDISAHTAFFHTRLDCSAFAPRAERHLCSHSLLPHAPQFPNVRSKSGATSLLIQPSTTRALNHGGVFRTSIGKRLARRFPDTGSTLGGKGEAAGDECQQCALLVGLFWAQ